MATTAVGDIVRRDSDSELFVSRRAGKLIPGYTVVRKATAALPVDANRPTLPEQVYTTSVTDEGKDPNVQDKHVVSEGKLEKKTDLLEVFKAPSLNTVFDSSSLTKPLVKVESVPGVLSSSLAIKVSEALGNLAVSVAGQSSEAQLAFVLGMLQGALTFSTSAEADLSGEDCYVVLDLPNQPKLRPEVVRETINAITNGTSYENGYRQYLRIFSSTTVGLINNKKLTVNSKVMAQHGVTPRFVSHCFDFSRPNYETYNPNQIRAWQLAQDEAFTRKRLSVNTTLHNTRELRSG